MTRKITQITVSAVPDESDIIYALCDDGSVWALWREIDGNHRSPWERMKDIPPGEEEKTA